MKKPLIYAFADEACTQMSGQIAAMVKQMQPAADIVREVMEAAEPLLKGASQWVE